MQFLVVARDGPDKLSRRAALREQHLAMACELKAAGSLLYGAALLDDAGQPNGSMEVFQFDSRAALDQWLEREPYVTGGVWAEVEVTPCRVGPIFGPGQ